MATSGVYDLTLQFGDIVSEALDIIQVAADGESVSGNLEQRSIRTFNVLSSEWQSQGIHLWTYTEASLLLQKGQFVYDFNDSSTQLTNNLIRDSLAADAPSGSGSVTVEDGTLFSDGDTFNIVLDDNSLFRTTINGAPVGDVITLTDVTTGDSSTGKAVYAYNDTFVPVSRVLDIRRVDSTTYEVPMNMEPRERYFEQPNKTSLGVPVIAYYSRQIPQGTMRIWSAPNDSTTYINFTYERKIQIITALTDDVDYPQYWIPAITANLAKKMMPKIGVSASGAKFITQEARDTLDQALGYDNAIYGHEIRIVNTRDR